MPSGPRIRDNAIFGLTTDNPLTAGATAFNSNGLADLEVVSSAHAVVTLDPRKINGDPEIVVITNHSASATVASITRGQYGTVARSHPQNTEWVHAPIDEDYIEILTSSTLPANPYAGQIVFQTDLNSFTHRNAANSNWVNGLAKDPTIQVFTSNGNWNKPSGLKYVRVRVVGGGGGGGGSTATAAGQASEAAGGGGGGYSESIILAASLASSVTVTVGAGGVGGNNAGAQAGNGGTSSFGAHLQATGGVGGIGGSPSASATTRVGQKGGAGSGGQINADGQPGGSGLIAAGGVIYRNNMGGSSVLGGGGQPNLSGPGGAGFSPSTGYGGGAAGVTIPASSAALAGQPGAAGVVIVEEYY